MTKRGIAVLATLLLMACGTKASQRAVQCAQQYWNGVVGTCLPAGWKTLTAESLSSLGVPEETVAAFQRSEAKSGQFDTVTVTREPLPTPMTTPQYSQANMLAVSTLPEYKLLDKSTVTVDGQEATLHTFSARPIPDAPVRRYEQLSAVSGQTGYTFTGSFPLSVDQTETQEVTLILSNVTFTNPSTAK